jgi:F-type H+-transporting ATPase subunit epsilon
MFQLSVITPSGKVFEDSIESLSAPGLMGGFEVYSQHMPFLSALKGGVISIRKSGKEFKSLKIDSGILEVDASHNVLLLADQITEGL